ncbi:MAG: hypothetical protein Q7U21_04825 [Lutibacter sp.]|nr:hypothetical protein [Lutibacter sp.]
MDKKTKKGTQISRRGILPILGGTLLLPFLGFGKTSIADEILLPEEDEEYQTLLKPDGTSVRVKVSTVKNSKIIQKNISNESFLNWLGRKL